MSESEQQGMYYDNSAWNRYVIENKELMENLEHVLKGEIRATKEKDYDGETIMVEVWYRPIDQEPPINDSGYHFTMLHMSQALDKTHASGNLTEEQAMNTVRVIMKALTNVYVVKYKDFGFKTLAETRTLLVSIMNLVKSHVTKSIGMKLIKELSSSYSISEQKLSALPQREPHMTM